VALEASNKEVSGSIGHNVRIDVVTNGFVMNSTKLGGKTLVCGTIEDCLHFVATMLGLKEVVIIDPHALRRDIIGGHPS
jgi:hypothetical protein